MSNNFYIYEHWRPDKGVCFWVGKGCGRRAYTMKRNQRHARIVGKLTRAGLTPEVRIIAVGLTEEEAFSLERDRIAHWRSRGDELANATDGGDGPSGFRHTDETKAKMSQSRRGIKQSPETIEKRASKLRGLKKSDAARRNLSLAKIGVPQKPHTPEHNAKIGAAALGRRDSPEVRARKKAAAQNRPPASREVRKKIAETVKSLWGRQDYRIKVIMAHGNRPPVSETTRAKMREAQRLRRLAENEGGR